METTNRNLQNQQTVNEQIIVDDPILAARIQQQNSEKHSILNDITINGETYSFEPFDISFPSSPYHYFSIILPKNTHPLSDDSLKIKYPYENRPEIILLNSDTTVNFAFQYTLDIQNTQEYLSTRLSRYIAILKHLNPTNIFFSETIVKSENDLTIACFDLCSKALDNDIYYFYFLTDFTDSTNPLDSNIPTDSAVSTSQTSQMSRAPQVPQTSKTEILGIFSCPLSVRNKWEPLFRQMIETISQYNRITSNDNK